MDGDRSYIATDGRNRRRTLGGRNVLILGHDHDGSIQTDFSGEVWKLTAEAYDKFPKLTYRRCLRWAKSKGKIFPDRPEDTLLGHGYRDGTGWIELWERAGDLAPGPRHENEDRRGRSVAVVSALFCADQSGRGCFSGQFLATPGRRGRLQQPLQLLRRSLHRFRAGPGT